MGHGGTTVHGGPQQSHLVSAAVRATLDVHWSTHDIPESLNPQTRKFIKITLTPLSKTASSPAPRNICFKLMDLLFYSFMLFYSFVVLFIG